MSKDVIKFIFKQLKPFMIRIVIIVSCMIIVSFFGILYPMLQRELFDNGIVSGDLDVVIRYTLFIFGLYIIEQVLTFIQFIHYQFVSRQMSYNLMYQAVNHSIKLKMAYHKDNNFLKTIGNVYSDIGSITQIINSGLLQTVVSFFKIIGGIIGLCLIDWRLTVFILTIVPIEIITKNFISSKRRKHFTASMKLNEKFSIWFGEIFRSIDVIKLWNLQNKQMKKFESLKKDMMKHETKMEYSDTYSNMSSQTLGMIFTHGLNLLGAILIMRNKLTIGGLFAFISYAAYVLQPASLLANLVYRLQNSIPAFKRFMEYFENDIENEDGISINDSKTDVRNISFDSVIFSYGNKEAVLNSINFSINKGEKVGFIGVNGSGKSSIISLLLRFYEPTFGTIKLNGVDIQNMALDQYRDLFCVMNQNISLFDDNIRNNINVLENLSEDEIRYYMELSTAADLIDSLPKGLDSLVGFNGSKLSGGERQKVALARTLAKHGKILILDEATANFDLAAEKRFNQYITNSNLYDIVIVISHREDILRRLDKIFYVDNGVIVDSGTFSELVEKNSNLFKTLAEEENQL
ncbi:ABC transporter ATP-binding protein [Anaerocolumna sp.]|uniref:ABC transporter ATP-binding protein n=1 Tax=Anaerocolumna sp. TaxID=2041569 RepID=UPI0028AD4C7D|nr:ABC transporter ATP-binding protein [Anaerocolumna sp.]